jgi:ATP-dependent helicase/nuclease subunit B
MVNVSIHLYLAPAAAGKTDYALGLVRRAAHGLHSIPRVCVPTQLQVRAWKRRLAEAGGAIGVRVGTFDALYAECLNAAGEVYTELTDPVQYRLLRAVVDSLGLSYYAPLADRPGFIQVLQSMIGELKAARIEPDAFAQAVAAIEGGPRLLELAQVYNAYQERLQAEGWADRAGMAWLAVEALEKRAPQVARDWPLLSVDGFDDLTEVQLAMLRVLAGRVGELIITLTGNADGSPRPPVHDRFCETARRLERALGVCPEPLPAQVQHRDAALQHLETTLFGHSTQRLDAAGAVELIEAPDRAGEVRAALRWLKLRLCQDGMRPRDVALLARKLDPYRPFILQTAAEFGLPVRLVGGLPLSSNPAIAALLDLLRLALPATANDAQPALPRRLVVEAWRSPYFDWSALPAEDATQPIGITPGDADRLDAAARSGQVIAGRAQWEEALALLAGRSAAAESDDEPALPTGAPIGLAAQELLAKFHRFVQRITPPTGTHSCREFVGWLETLIGPDPQPGALRFAPRAEPTSLDIVQCARQATQGPGRLAELADWDVAALQALKDVLRGLVWAAEAVACADVDFAHFFADLVGAVQAAFYRPPLYPEREEVLVADVVQARGVPFRAAAVLGLAEGEFPATLSEDPFLRDDDRKRLKEGCGLPLEPSTASAEAEFFYETMTRPRERLLLTRPRLADNGAPWEPSPYWEEVLRRIDARPQTLTGESIPPPEGAASWPELMESLAIHAGHTAVRDWVRRERPQRYAALNAAVQVFAHRVRADQSVFNGDLSLLKDEFAAHYGPQHSWSASRLEAYRSCPFRFFIAHVLCLEPRQEPIEGLDARQLGDIYHRILQHVYQAPGVSDPSHLDQLLAALPEVAQRILDEAPRREGFRETAWWKQTRAEIEDNVRRSLQALHDPSLGEGWIPVAFELRFERPDDLQVRDGEDCFRLHGVIDRIDQAPDGCLRIIDYKTGSPESFDRRSAAKGKKIQLALYALAVRDALRRGQPSNGFYWHVRHARPSDFTLATFRDHEGRDALQVAVEKAWEAVHGVRSGQFAPKRPDEGCPSYCPAIALCWHYQAGFGG